MTRLRNLIANCMADNDDTFLSLDEDVERLLNALNSAGYVIEKKLAKRPVAWRVKDYSDGWILFQNEASALTTAERLVYYRTDSSSKRAYCSTMQGLYVRETENRDVELE